MLCAVDVRQVFTGHMRASWALRFVDRLEREPWSHYRAELLDEASQMQASAGRAERDRLTLPFLGWGRPEIQRAEIQAQLYGLLNNSNAEPWQPSKEGAKPRVAQSMDEAVAFLTG